MLTEVVAIHYVVSHGMKLTIWDQHMEGTQRHIQYNGTIA